MQFLLYFFSNNRNNQKITKHNKKQKEKHDKILTLAKSKLDSIETLLSQALIDMEISHEEFYAIIRKKEKYERMKENVWNDNEKQENIRLNSVNSIKNKEFVNNLCPILLAVHF